jgi:hypothetical protein
MKPSMKPHITTITRLANATIEIIKIVRFGCRQSPRQAIRVMLPLIVMP